MPTVATKVAVSIPSDLYRAVERARKRHGMTRSAVMQDALRHWLRHEVEMVLVREYEEGYRRRPRLTVAAPLCSSATSRARLCFARQAF